MIATDPRIDAYIDQAAPFARPLLQHLRALIHKHCPGVEETIKWGFPHFVYKGKNLFSMASFKQHCACNFRLAPVMQDTHGLLQVDDREAMGHLGRITRLEDLPADKVFVAYLKEAMKLTEAGAQLPKAEKKAAPPEVVPDFILAELRKNKKALATFEGFSASHRREYLEWITEAKWEETRNKRLAQAIEWLAEGRQRHWKYM
ncbi:YdeI/OmpD-associated family protein [Taibaiella chishuiensis]|uniref:Uncharacterized protein YdeI (YjbR/CyaY-like superfamily) n=1 Tax=Taibaiella chishuiensis TaxID=1434707 RepID=A0A2P8D860_9BACT|nr:YdeI/OmpD-associated family protein [Taibaiella chishuiensis]PSK93393.1 uncharacterized protein YdeI (YjbR/CyaY-like superfamily) [Taibaiella chishuiensis]